MEKPKKISVEQCCIYYNIEISFVQQLHEHGLVELSRSGNEKYIMHEQLPDLERYMRLYYDLDINMSGMETIKHLLNRIQRLQREMKRLQNEH